MAPEGSFVTRKRGRHSHGGEEDEDEGTHSIGVGRCAGKLVSRAVKTSRVRRNRHRLFSTD